jgi:hypothetical protein
MATSPPVVRAAATGAARLLRVRWLVCAPIWACRAQWFRSIQADPRVRPYAASRRPAAQAA